MARTQARRRQQRKEPADGMEQEEERRLDGSSARHGQFHADYLGRQDFLTSEDGDDIALLCIGTDGKQLWKTDLGAKQAKIRFRMDEANQASPSPSTDGKHVWAFFGTGDFICCDFSGKIVWRFDAQERYGKFQIQHGMHVTPLLDGDRLYLSLLHSGEQDAGTWWVIALDKATGKEIWKVRRETDGVGEGKQSYASPILWRQGGAGRITSI